MRRPRSPSDAEIGVILTDAEICFVVGASTIASRLIDGNYPSVLQLIPASYPNQLRIAKDTLLTSLKRAKLLAKDSTSSVRLTMKEKAVEIRTQSIDTGDIEDNVDADYQGRGTHHRVQPIILDRRDRSGDGR